ncbi:MAG: hypothetical protein GC191_17755 [Azospirillum sp.]|nr:hypothetical protein [Azospirillum sp.]
MPHTVWVANGKGGVGKSVLMMALAAIFESSGRPLRLIDADDKAKLGEFMGPGNVLSLKIGASTDALRSNPSLAYSYWDRLAEEMVERDTGVDVGANMDRHILEWAEKSGLAAVLEESGVTMDVYVPITAEPLAVAGGLEVLETVERIFPQSRRILVLNRKAGAFDAYADTPEFRRIEAMRDRGLYIAEMAGCVSEAWTDFERLKLPPGRVIQLDARAVATMTGLGILAARRAIGDYATWLKQLSLALAPVTTTLPKQS